MRCLNNMGFTSELCIANKSQDENKVDNFYSVANCYCSYINNNWSIENYTFDDYLHQFYSNATDLNFEQMHIIKEYVKHNTITDQYGDHTIYTTIDDWCSSGSHFHDMIDSRTHAGNILYKDDILFILKNAIKKVKCYSIKLNRCFTVDEYDTIKSVPCDGVEVDVDGNFKRIYTSDDYDSCLYTTESNIDSYEFNAYNQLIDACMTILMTVDFNKQNVFYFGGR